MTKDTDIGIDSRKIAVIGLGYVGLPLAVEFGKHFDVVGLDLDMDRVESLMDGIDVTGELTESEIFEAKNTRFSHDETILADRNIFIVTVPTPVDSNNQPDFRFLKHASETVGKFLSNPCLVIYESTVYPGATEEICVPILEETSGLRFNQDFFCGYSPERINPGDKGRRLNDIVKITSGSTKNAAQFVDRLYAEIIEAGTHLVSSIRVAEAAKVIENAQRDINIAFVNELAIIFNKLNLDTQEVLEAAGTKWNFMRFSPGLVGGHCIGVDPYYLTYKATIEGYDPQIITAGRVLNDSMGRYVAAQLVKTLVRKGITVNGARVLVLGFAFKENCRDFRNTKVIDIVNEIESFGCIVDVHDPLVDPTKVAKEYGIDLVQEINECNYEGVIIAVRHSVFVDLGIKKIRGFAKSQAVVYDLKSIFPSVDTDGRL